jgi:hypothetical protein
LTFPHLASAIARQEYRAGKIVGSFAKHVNPANLVCSYFLQVASRTAEPCGPSDDPFDHHSRPESSTKSFNPKLAQIASFTDNDRQKTIAIAYQSGFWFYLSTLESHTFD